jgi:hypothetical protein
MGMKMRIRLVIALAVMTGILLGQAGNVKDWHVFKSTAGFSIKYPPNWLTKGISKDRLMILSSEGGAEALIIRRGQAVISVMEEEKYQDSTMEDVVDYYVRDHEVLSRRDVGNSDAGRRGCREMKEIVSREPAVPAEDVPGDVPKIINTEYFCEIGNHKFVGVLRNFEGDKRQSEFQRVAFRVVASLRVDGY